MAANPIDLCTLQQLKDFMNAQGVFTDSAAQDTILQGMITSASLEWLWYTGKAPMGIVPAQSPFVQVVNYDEWLDGNGNNRIFPRQQPIRSVTLCEVDGGTVSPSASVTTSGYLVDPSGTHLIMRNGIFNLGTVNVHLVYTSGYDMIPPDVNEKCIMMIQATSSRRQRVDQSSVALPQGGGTATYRGWAIAPDVREVMNAYKRRSL
jgi:hypothetical protein